MNMVALACIVFLPLAGSAMCSLGMLFGNRAATRRDAQILKSLDARHRDDRAIIEEQAEKIATLEAANEILWEEGDFPDDFDDDALDVNFEIDWERDARLGRKVNDVQRDGELLDELLFADGLDDPASVVMPKPQITDLFSNN